MPSLIRFPSPEGDNSPGPTGIMLKSLEGLVIRFKSEDNPPESNAKTNTQNNYTQCLNNRKKKKMLFLQRLHVEVLTAQQKWAVGLIDGGGLDWI